MKKALLILIINLSLCCLLIACGSHGPSDETNSSGETDTDTETRTDTDENNESQLEATQGLDYYLLDDGAYAVAVGKAKLLDEIVIPSTYQGAPVTQIKADGFRDAVNLKKITIPNCITTIGNSAFSGCTALTEIYFNAKAMDDLSSSNYVFSNAGQNGDGIKVTIGKDVTKIPAYLFNPYYYSPKITSVTFEDGCVCESIGEFAFKDCTGLTSVTIPDSVTSIGSSVFSNCTSLTEINFNAKAMDGLSKDNYVFSNAGQNGDGIKVTIGKEVTKIPAYLFNDATYITSVTFEEGSVCRSIGNYAFYNCTSLEEINFNAIAMDDLNSRNYVFYNAGQNGDGIKVTIGKEVTKIPACLFYPYSSSSYSPNIKSVIFEEGSVCESIGDYAFYYSTSLTSVTIPDSVTSIGEYAFNYCPALTEINFNAIAMDDLSSYNNYVFYNAGQNGDGIKVTIGKEVTKIPAYLFNDATYITSVTFEEGSVCRSIGNNAFCNCTYLEEINFNAIAMDDLSEDNDVFYNAGINGDGIKVTIGKEVTKIPAYLFYPYNSSSAPTSSTPKITSVTFEEGATCESIGDSAFSSCYKLTSIEIPNSVTSIGRGAFYGCYNLTSIEIPDRVTSIGSSAFYYCESLTSVTIPDSVTSIGSSVFSNCTSLTEINFNAKAMDDLSKDNYVFSNAGKNGEGIKVTIGKEVTKIPAYLFYPSDSSNSPKIISVTFEEDSVCDSIGERAFYYCTGLISITIPDSVTSIGNYAFYNCTSLTEINFNAKAMDDLSSYNYVFYNAGKNGEGIKVTIGKEVTKIPAYLFCPYYSSSYSPKITSVVFEEGSVCESIGNYAFYYSTSLTSINIPDSVTTIGSNAFSGCTSLTSITIGEGVTSIGEHAFSGCTALTEINFNAIAMDDLSEDNYAFSNAGINGEGITVTIGKNVTKIPAYLFCPRYSNSLYSPKITSMEFEEGSVCESIGDYAFYMCKSLTSIEIPDSVTSIGYYAFKYCTSLTSIEIPDSVTSIGSSAFYYCESLTSVTIGDSVTSIGYDAFYNCTSLEEINFNAIAMNDLSFRNYVFYNVGQKGNGIKVTIGKEVTKIPAYLFHTYEDDYSYSSSSHMITSVTFEEDSVCRSIGGVAFYDCYNLTSIEIPDSVTSIGSSAFGNCTRLTSVTIGESVTSIGSSAFYDCYNLTSIEIPDSVTSIGSSAFRNCTSLTSVTFEDTDGWYVTKTEGATSGTDVDLSKASTNATYLTDTYDNYYWYKKQ